MTREISRQAFVRGALGAVAAGALLGSCRPTPEAAPPAAGSLTSSTVSGLRDWAALDDAIEGRVVLPSSADYTAAKNLFNSRFDDSTPAAVVVVQSIDDVQRVVEFAARNGIKVAARSGGHSYIGASAANSAMIIDLRQLPGGISYDEDRGLATISAATQLDSVQTSLAAHDRSIPSGSCPTVGIAGLALGGGLGCDARRSGLTCDALVSASVVLPSGEAINASADDHADLFWALRGGGGGNFGVVTSFTFRTFPATDRDIDTLVFPEGATAQAIAGWHEWLHNADHAIWGMVNITAGSGSGGCTIVLATPARDGPGRASDLSAAIGVHPVSNTSRTLNRIDFVHYFEGGAQATQPRAFVAGSDIIGEMTSYRRGIDRRRDVGLASTSGFCDHGDRVAVRIGDRRRFRRHSLPLAASGGQRSVVYRGGCGVRQRVAGECTRGGASVLGGRLRQLPRTGHPCVTLFR